MLSVEHVSKSYHQKQVLTDVSFSIPSGRFVSIIGPNGAGKSTLLSVMAQLATHSEGNVSIDGKSLSEYHRRDLAKIMSFLRQNNSLQIKLTVRELVAFGRFPYSHGKLTEEDEIAIDEAIGYLNLESLAHMYIDEISGGERQRAFIAMTIAQNTDYILLDEPLNNLDMKHSVEIMRTLRHLVDDLGKTVLIVIHDINFASYYSDDIIALKKGHLIAHNTVSNMINTDMLKNVYDMDIKVSEQHGKLLCDYFR